MDSIEIIRPDDWHLHLRDGAMLRAVVPHTARQFGRAIVMPNLATPVTTVADAVAYRQRIIAALPEGSDFQPLMTGYLTDQTEPDEITRGHAEGVFAAVKYYPAGATTNSASGVTDVRNVHGVLERMQEIGLPLLVHGEVTDPAVDVFDREAVFIDQVLAPVCEDFPALKIVFEHATTEQAVAFVRSQGGRMAATVTPHHLMINRTDLFRGGLRPHLYCLPVAKRERHRLALREAVTSGEPMFFLGTDSAPHPRTEKESACGCAGVFSAPTALELYATVFDEEDALDKLEGFASLNGPAFYGLPVNQGVVRLVRETTQVAAAIAVGGETDVVPFMAGETLAWRLQPNGRDQT